jgi:hypothetical protein
MVSAHSAAGRYTVRSAGANCIRWLACDLLERSLGAVARTSGTLETAGVAMICGFKLGVEHSAPRFGSGDYSAVHNY